MDSLVLNEMEILENWTYFMVFQRTELVGKSKKKIDFGLVSGKALKHDDISKRGKTVI